MSGVQVYEGDGVSIEPQWDVVGWCALSQMHYLVNQSNRQQHHREWTVHAVPLIDVGLQEAKRLWSEDRYQDSMAHVRHIMEIAFGCAFVPKSILTRLCHKCTKLFDAVEILTGEDLLIGRVFPELITRIEAEATHYGELLNDE